MVSVIIPAPGEPEVTAWRSVSLARFVDELSNRLDLGGGRRALAVDGRSASGKSTLARRLAAALPEAVVVGTDDIAWHESMFAWTSLLVDGLLRPFRAGDVVSYRPPVLGPSRPGGCGCRTRLGAVARPRGRWILPR